MASPFLVCVPQPNGPNDMQFLFHSYVNAAGSLCNLETEIHTIHRYAPSDSDA